jgi:hypothetical protein
MYLIFVDECGYRPDWEKETAIKEQPVYVLAAVAVPSEQVAQLYEAIRNSVDQLKLPETDAQALGRREEIKANAVDRGDGFWGKNPSLRDRVRQIYLDQQATTYFVVCVDKARHLVTYLIPEDPAHLGLKFLFERIQGFLAETNRSGFVLIDANERLELELRERSSQLLLEGSWGLAVSRFYGVPYEWRLKMSNILEVHFGDSKFSLGLQIADFVARHTYSWWKSGKGPGYAGWNYIEPRLYRYPNYRGWGYKEFP